MDLGISKDDMEFAFERHATSKIREAADLESVKSMGFRGEALASIAAIANVEMISRTEKEESGNKIVVEGGKVLETQEIAATIGTTITVKNLFFNTPVRYKFLKKDFTEAGYIEDVITRIALANPQIAIKLINGNKTIIQTTGTGNLKNAVYSIYGKEIAEGTIDVSYEYEDIKISGVVGKPEIARGNRSYQLFFVNRRYIKDKTLSAAAEQAFKGLLTIGKYGFLVLNVEIEPKKIDVNVHPTKLEIRWSEEQKVFKAIYHAIKESLLKEELVKDSEKSIEQNTKEQIIESNNIVLNEESKAQEETKSQTMKMPSFINLFKKKTETEELADINNRNTIQELYNSKNNLKNEDIENNNNSNKDFKIPTEEQVGKMTKILNLQKDMDKETNEIKSTKQDFNEMYVKTFGKLPEVEESKEETKAPSIDLSSVKNMSVFEEKEEYKAIPNYKYIGALFSTYIVIEIKDEIYIIDQHAAHERIMYEKVKENFYSDKEKDSQIMLLPDIINLSHKEKAIVKENTELFKKAGFIFEEFGENTIRLIGVPSLCMDLDTKELFLQLLDEIDTVAITATQEKEEKFIVNMFQNRSYRAVLLLS